MSYNIVLTTAEDIVAVVDAVIAKGSEAAKDFIAEFTGIATDDQVLKALQMACELQLIVFDSSRGCYGSPSFLARKLVSASSDELKKVVWPSKADVKTNTITVLVVVLVAAVVLILLDLIFGGAIHLMIGA